MFPLTDFGKVTQNFTLCIDCLILFIFFILPSAVRQAEKNSPERRSSPVGPPLSDEEVHRQDGASPAQEIALDVQQVSVDCPICQGSFPADEIEMHAAYCDGAPSESPPEVAVPGQELLALLLFLRLLCKFALQ